MKRIFRISISNDRLVQIVKYAVIILLTFNYLITEAGQTDDPKPNIIIIITDDQGYGDVGFNGCKDIPTPGIDRIAANGAVFTSGYVSFAVCGPSRAGLLTGKYQDRFGFSRNPLYAPNDVSMGLPLAEQTMADLVKQAGYTTAVIGKWHMGAHKQLHPNKRGFDEFFGFLGGGHRYFPEELTLGKRDERKGQFDEYKSRLLHNSEQVDEKEYLTDAFSREAVNYIRKNKDNPFFLYLAYNAPHTPLQATEKYLSRFQHITNEKRRTYAAMVSAVDDGVSNILNLLDELKLTENTIVFFLSDNGGPTNDNASSNGPLRGRKGDFYDGGIRVPFAVQWKGQIPAGMKYDNPVISLDIFATVSALSGIKPKNTIDGKNLIPYLQKTIKNAPHNFLFWRHFDQGRYAVRSVDRKMIINKGAQEFFKIKEDIGEKTNVADNNSKPVAKLNKQLENWKNLLIDPLFLGLMQDEEYTKSHPDRWKIED
jgi:arylsulfatase A-like enzyme